MGKDAMAYLWVGFRHEDGEFGEAVSGLPDECGDYELQNIELCDGLGGFGIVVFFHDWDYGVIKFDFHEIQNKIEKAKAELVALLNDHKIDLDVGVWFQADFR